MASRVYETIKNAYDLPSPTGVALRILELAQDEDSNAEQIAVAIEADPAIAGRLLKLVNSPLAGMPRQIVSVQRAVALLGTWTITNLALGFSLVSNHRKGRCGGFNYELFWSESLARAVAARHITSLVKSFAPDEAFTCGLLCQVGRLAFATAFPEGYNEALESYAAALENPAADGSQRLREIERSIWEIDHNELAAEMMTDWHMPSIFCEAVRHQGILDAEPVDPPTRTTLLSSILNLSGLVSLILTQPTIYRDRIATLTRDANRMGINPCVCHEMFDHITGEWQEVGAIFSVRTRRVPSLAEMYAHAQERQALLQERPPEAGAWPPARVPRADRPSARPMGEGARVT